jgi:hypothetical protein
MDKKQKLSQAPGVTPIILATQKAEIRRIMVRSQSRQNSLRDLISKIPRTKKDWWNDSSDRVPALQMQSLTFKAQSHQKKRKKKCPYVGIKDTSITLRKSTVS